MAEYTAGPNGGPNAGGFGQSASTMVNISAAAVSIALVVGVGVWGYKLLVRDVTGVPVVRAIEGDMRVSPANPGGEIAAHVGLSVNDVPALGGAAEPEDRLVLAPNAVGLEAEDLEVVPGAAPGETSLAEAGEVAPVEDVVIDDALADAVAATLTEGEGEEIAAAPDDAPVEALTAEDVLALADQIAATAQPLAELDEGEDVPVAVAVNGVAVNPNVIPDAVPGVRVSLRPTPRPTQRPASATVVPASATQTAAAVAPAPSVSTDPIPVGTKLVQLGAFDSPEIAASEWARMTGQFPDFFDGKDQIIQEASSGGRTFYRLRAINFADLNDARRFCAALSAEGADCIPVVVR